MPDIDLEDWEILAEPVQPDAAIEFWKDRAKLTWDNAKALADGARQRAFYIAGVGRQDLVDLVSDGLKEALEQGETLEDFKRRILEAIKTQGWKDYRIETIFRTNMQSAYAAGRYKKMQEVKKSRPYWQYMSVMDKRTRPSHAILHEKIYPADHEFWDSNYPPNGFRCRCCVTTLSERQVKDQGLTVEKEMPKADMWTDPKTGMEYFVNFPGADKGFRNNPFKEWANGKISSDLAGKKMPQGWNYQQLRLPAPKPDIYEQAFGITKQAPFPLTEAAQTTNPNYGKDTSYQINCQRCVPTYELRRRGYDVTALPKPSRKVTDGIYTSFDCFKNPVPHGARMVPGDIKLTKKELLKQLKALPDGARVGIGWNWPGGGGHTIACEKQNGKLIFVDPQIGQHGEHVLGQATRDRGYSWYRMDDIELDETKLKLIATANGQKP